MITKCLSFFMCMLILVSASGCGSLFSGTSETVNINSNPEKAKVMINGGYMGLTPLTLSLSRDKDYNILVKKEGYEEASAVLSRKFNAVALLNTIGLLCWVVDFVTGGLWKFDRNNVGVELEPVKKAELKNSFQDLRLVLAP
ncbi:MAG TPA: PEGA domain-containing protein [Bacteriovoracaceae bacterium]|nr:PEGA domain-containing protein [Bacteriovoracaceae bacterium]